MEPWLAPLAAGCMEESGSRLPQSKVVVGNRAQIRVCGNAIKTFLAFRVLKIRTVSNT